MQESKQVPHFPEMQRIVAWKLWYSDKTVDSTEMGWSDAPIDDVQFLMVYFEEKDGLGRHTRLAFSGCDVYHLDMKNNVAEAHFQCPTRLQNIKDGTVKHGKFMDYQAMIELEKEAYDDFGEGWLVPPAKVEEQKRVPEKMDM